MNFLVFSNLYQMMPVALKAPVLIFIRSFHHRFLGTLILHASGQKNLQSYTHIFLEPHSVSLEALSNAGKGQREKKKMEKS